MCQYLPFSFARLIAECDNLRPIEVDGVEIDFVGFDSMNDQKTLNAIVGENCTKRCPACNLLPKEHMRFKQCFYEINEKFEKSMCLSSLHFGLNLFEHLINKVGGHQDFKSDTANGEFKQQKKWERIQTIKDMYWEHRGIRLSYLLKGQGTTNTGNTVRRVFEDPNFLAAQIGVSIELVKGLINLWKLVRSNLVLDPKAFYEYCQSVKARYVQEIPWCYMNPSLLKVIDHGRVIIARLPPTITLGMLSEG